MRGPHPLGEVPDKVLHSVGEQIVHRLAVGHSDISGDDFGTIFAKAVGGAHRAAPHGLADVVMDGSGWSLKTVQDSRPFAQQKVRLISGRNSPDFSMGIENPHEDPAATGRAVIAIWNGRIDTSMLEVEDLRVVALVRNMASREFTLFEEELHRFVPGDYLWAFNSRGNLEGRELSTGAHRFTWQPHGSQFTVIRDVPGSARKFSIVPNVPIVEESAVLQAINFAPDWVAIH